jgi:hypothetical protein
MHNQILFDLYEYAIMENGISLKKAINVRILSILQILIETELTLMQVQQLICNYI